MAFTGRPTQLLSDGWLVIKLTIPPSIEYLVSSYCVPSTTSCIRLHLSQLQYIYS